MNGGVLRPKSYLPPVQAPPTEFIPVLEGYVYDPQPRAVARKVLWYGACLFGVVMAMIKPWTSMNPSPIGLLLFSGVCAILCPLVLRNE
jgi:hypothetical protein